MLVSQIIASPTNTKNMKKSHKIHKFKIAAQTCNDKIILSISSKNMKH